MTGHFLNGYLAQQYRGATLGLEHRFYGESQPLAGTDGKPDFSDLSLLNSRQALADLNNFIQIHAKKTYPGSKFVCLGGSYPGSLAAYVMQVYPEGTFSGCLSFSAPVFPKMDFFEYGQMVYRAMGAAGAKLSSG